ncbi:MAG: helix-turn-helix domain-containing protein [Nitriliruptor sp.]|uniref:helix-turn-helix domain-containing protein n=1 Tax=Nitriliruptor sp. TaxID=2448056 RepID=UPI0034A0177E
MREDAPAEAGLGRRVRRRRRALGLSQDELAARAGISRQGVGAIERGEHLPRVDAALGLARALGTTVEELLAVGPPVALQVLGGEIPEGRAVRASRVGDHTVVVPLPTAADGESWPVPDAVINSGRVEVLDGADLDGFVVVGCDPALGLLAGLAPPRGPGRILPVLGSSAAARLALTTGRAHAAVVHDTSPPAPGRPDRVHRLPLATWRTGLAARPERSGTLVDALAGRGEVVQRDTGAAAQLAYERVLDAAGAGRPHGAVATGHLDAARRAIELGLAAVTIEPVAEACGLSFHPLETHAVELWIDAGAVDHPGARVLGELLGSARLRSRLAALPGYQVAS